MFEAVKNVALRNCIDADVVDFFNARLFFDVNVDDPALGRSFALESDVFKQSSCFLQLCVTIIEGWTGERSAVAAVVAVVAASAVVGAGAAAFLPSLAAGCESGRWDQIRGAARSESADSE